MSEYRAEITATRFANEYHWGDLKGSPREMMERYFDAFLYLANWGTRHLMFRLPTATRTTTGTRRRGELAAMVQARSELAAGDLRLLYLGWLLAVQSDDVDDEDTEPPVPAGLRELSAPLRAVADFLDIDEDLLAVAAQASPGARKQDHGGLADWITSLPANEKDALLARVVSGERVRLPMVRIGLAAWPFISRTAATGSCATSCVFAQERGALNVVEKTTFDRPARASAPGSPAAANPDMTR